MFTPTRPPLPFSTSSLNFSAASTTIVPDLNGLPIRIVVFFSGLTVGVISAQANRKHERAIIDKINPNLAALIILSSFLFWSFFHFFDQFTEEFMFARHKLPESLRAKVMKIDCHILGVLSENRVVHPLFEGIVEFLYDVRRSPFGCDQSSPLSHGKVDALFLYGWDIRKHLKSLFRKKGDDLQLPC